MRHRNEFFDTFRGDTFRGDGRDEARNQFDFALKNRREQLDKGMREARLGVAEDAGRHIWHNEGLGRVTLRVEGPGAVFDEGEWRSSVGEKQEKDGSRTLILMDPPLAGFEFQPKQEARGTTLVLELPQQSYIFEKQAAQDSGKP